MERTFSNVPWLLAPPKPVILFIYQAIEVLVSFVGEPNIINPTIVSLQHTVEPPTHYETRLFIAIIQLLLDLNFVWKQIEVIIENSS